LGVVRGHLATLAQGAVNGTRQDLLGKVFVEVHDLTEDAEKRRLSGPARIGSALGRALKKLLEKPMLTTPSVLQASAAALELMAELYALEKAPNLEQPRVQILTVDDDPIACRTISNSLQLAFGRPDCAGSGETAIKNAAEKAYDVIFMDVMMPGMDGFAACSQIRQTALNAKTPVVFVTSKDDEESRQRAREAGGDGYITKPVLPVEIALTALTFILRGRLKRPATRTEQAMALA
jgi:CheY-like chemotaxis protein